MKLSHDDNIILFKVNDKVEWKSEDKITHVGFVNSIENNVAKIQCETCNKICELGC